MTQIPNFAKVDGRVWRGARPDAAGAMWLGQQGIRTVINLEWEQKDATSVWRPINVEKLPINLVRVRDFEPLPFFASSLEDRHVIRALRAIEAGPAIVYVHCRSGQNRTGVVVAAYRIILSRWSSDAALDEFAKFRGWWAWADAGYIRSIAEPSRLEWFRAMVAAV